MFQVAKDLVRNKIIDFTQIVFIDFSEYYKTDFDFDKLLEEYYTIFPDKEPFFIFDEVQEVNNFRQ
jgi:predicted AAA+ superfamily ATPase